MPDVPFSEAGHKLLAWLRAGYPDGVPREDYVSIYGILHRRLTSVEADEVATALVEGEAMDDGVITHDEIRASIEQLAKEQASDEDIARVSRRLAAAGWPLDEQALDVVPTEATGPDSAPTLPPS